MTKCVYSKKMCNACDELKETLRDNQVEFFERSGDRLDLDPRFFDAIGKEAFLQLQMQNLTFPVEIDIVDKC